MDLTAARFNRLSSISAQIAQVCLASIVIPFWVDKYDSMMLLLGVILTGISVIVSVLFVRVSK